MVSKIIKEKIKKNVDLKLGRKVKKLKIGINYAEGVAAYLSLFTIDNVIIGEGKVVLTEVGIDIDKPFTKKLAETLINIVNDTVKTLIKYCRDILENLENMFNKEKNVKNFKKSFVKIRVLVIINLSSIASHLYIIITRIYLLVCRGRLCLSI